MLRGRAKGAKQARKTEHVKVKGQLHSQMLWQV